MATYLFALAAIIAFMIFLGILTLFGGKIAEMAKADLQGKLRGTFFNGKIKVQTVTYLKTCVSLLVIVQTIDFTKPFSEIRGQLSPILFLIIYPIICIITLFVYRDRLDNPFVKAKVGNMYEQVHLSKNKWSIYYYPCYLIRRLMFVVFPVIMPTYPYFQL
jgi:hypothetical protein